jgi:3-hydroxyisobutyrate dehydrogenase
MKARSDATRVGFVGLGRMGRPMATRLHGAGFALTGFDADQAAAERFRADSGAKICSSLAELGGTSNVVITMLPNASVVREVIVEVIDCLDHGTVVIDMSSSSPTGTQQLGRLLAARSIDLIDAPVSGGVPRAEAGTLAIMVGGEPHVLERCRPLLAAMGDKVFATGPLGSGHAMKALNNLVSAAALLASAEALLIGQRFGLDPDVMVDVLNASSGRNNSTENKFKQQVFSRRFSSGFALHLMVKDLATALDLAEATGTPASFSDRCRELWSAAQTYLEPDADHTAVVQWLEKLAGSTLESSS